MEVKKTFLATLIVILTFLISCSEELKEVDFSSLQDRNGVMYEVNTEDPFTGIGVTKFDNGQYKTKTVLYEFTWFLEFEA